jgi:hypothetical protein
VNHGRRQRPYVLSPVLLAVIPNDLKRAQGVELRNGAAVASDSAPLMGRRELNPRRAMMADVSGF